MPRLPDPGHKLRKNRDPFCLVYSYLSNTWNRTWHTVGPQYICEHLAVRGLPQATVLCICCSPLWQQAHHTPGPVKVPHFLQAQLVLSLLASCDPLRVAWTPHAGLPVTGSGPPPPAPRLGTPPGQEPGNVSLCVCSAVSPGRQVFFYAVNGCLGPR